MLNKTGKEDGGNVGHNKNPNLWIIVIYEGEEFQVNGIDQAFDMIIEEKFPKLRKGTPIQI